MTARRAGLVAAFCAYVAATAAHIGYVVEHEPFSFDAWNVAFDTRAQPITIARFFAYWRFEYAHANPRLGQPLAYLAYKVAGFAEIATPLAFLALTLAITAIGLGRLPRRGRDLALWAFVIGFAWLALPELGRTLFARAYATNYVYTAAIQLWFLVPLRLQPDAPTTRTGCATYAMAGLLAGTCNEHTGVALVAFLAGHAWWLRRARRPYARSVAGAIGALLGFAALLLAPGQNERYGGLAQRTGIVGEVVARGVGGGVHLLGDYLVYAAPLLGILAVIAIHALATRADGRPAVRLVALALGAGLVVVATLCASPKLGSRFYIAPLALLLAATVALLDATIASPARLAPLVILALAASAYAAARTIPLFHAAGAAGRARTAALEASARDTTFAAEPYPQVAASWWFLGDDFRDPQKRAMVARYFHLAKVTLRR